MHSPHLVELAFRLVLYVLAGLTMELLFSVHGIELCLGLKDPLRRRVPRRYLEGFVSVYMIPLHGFAMLLLFEPIFAAIHHLHWSLRFATWALLITAMEAAWGWALHRAVGFYPWDYYRESRFRVFRHGYTLWTLVPLWGVAGLILERYSALLQHLAPAAAAYLLA